MQINTHTEAFSFTFNLFFNHEKLVVNLIHKFVNKEQIVFYMYVYLNKLLYAWNGEVSEWVTNLPQFTKTVFFLGQW